MSTAAQRLRETEIERRSTFPETHTIPSIQPIRKRITRGEKALWVLGLITIFALCIVIVSNETALYNETKQVNQLENQIEQVSSTNTGLETQVSQLSAPERIIQYAENKLGMTLNVNNVKVVN